MSHAASPLAAFHLTGDRSGLQPVSESGTAARPALFGNYVELSRLRFDFPLVLSNKPGGHYWMRSLADIIDDILVQVAEPGTAGEEKRRQLLAQEQAIRTLLATGLTGSLSLFWEAARRQLTSDKHESDVDLAGNSLNEFLAAAGTLPEIDGEIAQCDPPFALKLMRTAWRDCEHGRTLALATQLRLLIHKLSEILEVDYRRSAESRDPARLERSMGGSDRNIFDFGALSELLQSATANTPSIDTARKLRIQGAIDVLQSQRFVDLVDNDDSKATELHRFEFSACEEARAAFHARMPEMAELVKAVTIAELEIQNQYDESRHDSFFDQFNANNLGPADLAVFPSYLVGIEQADDAARATILEALADGLPFKIVAQTKDVLGPDSLDSGLLSFGTKGQQLARMAAGSGQAFVLQAPNSSLYRLGGAVQDGMSCAYPALFSIYAGPDYLVSAAAAESRAFPCFVYNPSAGSDLAARFDLSGNPRAQDQWPEHQLVFENEEHGSQSETVRFTLIDFVAALPAHARRFVPVPGGDPAGELLPVDRFLDPAARPGRGIPYVYLLDDDNRLYRAVVDDKLIEATRRCADAWRGLQELGGINNSHAARAVAEAMSSLEPPAGEESTAEPDAPVVAAPAQEKKALPATEAQSETSSDDPWIESIRCTTCNECTNLNDRMFAYDADMRAYIKDSSAGSYRELVEAAEACQVEIIHPGKPRDPNEAGLDELIKRAEPFM